VSPKKDAAGRSMAPITVNSWPSTFDGLADGVEVGEEALLDMAAPTTATGNRWRLSFVGEEAPHMQVHLALPGVGFFHAE